MGSSISSAGGGIGDAVAGDNLAFSNPDLIQINYALLGSYTKFKETRSFRAGVLRVKFTAKSGYAAINTYYKIYVNGVARGTERIESTAVYTVFSEDITVEAGDLVQVYGHSNANASGLVKDLEFYCESPHDDIAII